MKPLALWRQSAQYVTLHGYKMATWTTPTPNDKKPWLLLIHGFPTSSWDWSAIWDDLENKFNLAAIDMIGFGLSEKPTTLNYLLTHQADLQEAFVETLGLSEMHILAHDYGDSVAQELLARHNENGLSFAIKSVCFLNGGLFPGYHHPRPIQKLMLSPVGPILSRLMNRARFEKSFSEVFAADTQPSEEELDNHWALICENGGAKIMHKILRYLPERRQHEIRWRDALTDARMPLTMINGGEDPVSGRHLYERFCTLLPDAPATLFDDIGHYPQTEAPDRVVAAFMAFHEGHVAVAGANPSL